MWAVQLYHQVYEYTLNDTVLVQGVLPILRRAVNFYSHLQVGKFNANNCRVICCKTKRNKSQIKVPVPSAAGGYEYHLPATLSPEYATVNDTNYDLALYRWGLVAITDACDRLLAGSNDASAAVSAAGAGAGAALVSDSCDGLAGWKDSLAHLAAFPVDGTGYMIGAGRALTTGWVG
jgi:hypothetical protein